MAPGAKAAAAVFARGASEELPGGEQKRAVGTILESELHRPNPKSNSPLTGMKKKTDGGGAEAASRCDKEDEDAYDALIGPPQRRGTVAQFRRSIERSLRNAQAKTNQKRRLDTLVRACTPRERGAKRSRAAAAPSRVAAPDVVHAQRLEAFAMHREDARADPKNDYEEIYMRNYDAWFSHRAHAMSAAAAADRAAELERAAERQLAIEKKDRERHRAAFRPSLMLICPTHETSERASSEQVSLPRIADYFGTVGNAEQRKIERIYARFFAETVASSRVLVLSWPATDADAETGDDKDSASVGCARSATASAADRPATAKNGARAATADGVTDFFCAECAGRLVLDYRAGMTSCVDCGATRAGGYGLGVQQTFAEAQSSLRSAAPYERVSHLKEFVARLEGSERTQIPEIVIFMLLRELEKHGVDPIREPGRVTYPFIRSLLQRIGYCHFFENVPQIIGILTKRPCRRFTDEEKNRILIIFREIQGPFEKHKGKRKNFLSYAFTLYKILELLNLREFLPFLPLLKAPTNLLAADELWKLICNDLGYEFVATT